MARLGVRRGKAGRGRAMATRTKIGAKTATRVQPKKRVARVGRRATPVAGAETTVPGPPSSLALDRHASAARSGRAELREHLLEHTETGPALTAGDVDANWETAFSSGDEAPGGDNPTPGQDIVEQIGRALGLEYADNEELHGEEKLIARDRHRWELDPASSEDYRDRTKRR